MFTGPPAVYCVEETTMTLQYRILSLAVALVLLFGGPLATVANAQSAAQNPDVFKETLKSPSAPEPVAEGDVVFNETFYDVTAGVMTAFLVPGRAITCVVAGAFGTAVLLLTFGSGYKAAAGVLNEGCAGKWIVRGEDIAPDRAYIPPPIAERK